MKNRNLLMTIFIIAVSFSCKKGEKEIESDYIASTIKTITIGDSTKWIIILPGMGCHGCIQEGEVFMRDNINNNAILFVLTKIESLKILQQKIGVELKGHSNIYFDSKEGFKIPTNNSIYPCVVYLENGEIKSYEFQSPGTNAFENLRSQIKLTK